MLGTIEGFDERRGDGWIRGDDGEIYYLHCIEIADGSRRIDSGSRVSFARRPGLRGRDEGSDVQVLDAPERRT